MKRCCTIAGLLLLSVLMSGCISARKIKQKPVQHGQASPSAVDAVKTKSIAIKNLDTYDLYDVDKDSSTESRLGINKKRDHNDIDFDLDDEE